MKKLSIILFFLVLFSCADKKRDKTETAVRFHLEQKAGGMITNHEIKLVKQIDENTYNYEYVFENPITKVKTKIESDFVLQGDTLVLKEENEKVFFWSNAKGEYVKNALFDALK